MAHPFRVEEAEVLTDRVYRAAQMPVFWQAFDSLEQTPRVMAQGTLKGGDVTVPTCLFHQLGKPGRFLVGIRRAAWPGLHPQGRV